MIRIFDLVPGQWVQDPADYSWAMIDHDGYMYRVFKSLKQNTNEWLWNTCWVHRDSIHVPTGGSGSYENVEDAKTMMESIAAMMFPDAGR